MGSNSQRRGPTSLRGRGVPLRRPDGAQGGLAGSSSSQRAGLTSLRGWGVLPKRRLVLGGGGGGYGG